MSRFAPYLGIVAALAVGVLATIVYQGVVYLSTPTITTSPAPQKESEIVTATSTAETVLKKIPETTPTAAQATPQKVSFDAAGVVLLRALVNIICYAPPASGLRSISASGVIIDPKGIILTNAHVAQYYLLADRGVSCSVRSGNPAVDKYRAALMYISPFWITNNPSELTATDPVGTGQYDFALLAVTESVSSASLPTEFSYVPLAAIAPQRWTPVAIASYGAQALPSREIQSDLRPTLVVDSVKDVFTFGSDTIDVLALGGSSAAQEGSSGWGIVNASGKLIATITTSAREGDTNKRSLHAITARYIRAEYEAETGQSLDTLLSQDPRAAVASFAPRIPALESFLTAHLP